MIISTTIRMLISHNMYHGLASERSFKMFSTSVNDAELFSVGVVVLNISSFLRRRV